jgi:hypothetical protein
MGETTTAPMSVAQARRHLANTSCMSSEQVDALQKVIDRFLAARPRNQQCVACGSAIWSEHSTNTGDASWACAGCHRPASLTPEEWWAQQQAAEAVRMRQDAAAAAAAPNALQEALARRTEAAATLGKLELAQADARAALAAAQVRHDGAVAAMAEAEQASITRLAAGMTGERAETGAPTVGAARGNLRTAEDALSAARGARGLIGDQMHYAQRNLANAETAVRTAAIAVLASENLEPLIEQAITARADYIESIASLGWLSKYPPAKPGALECWPLKAAGQVADATCEV